MKKEIYIVYDKVATEFINDSVRVFNNKESADRFFTTFTEKIPEAHQKDFELRFIGSVEENTEPLV